MQQPAKHRSRWGRTSPVVYIQAVQLLACGVQDYTYLSRAECKRQSSMPSFCAGVDKKDTLTYHVVHEKGRRGDASLMRAAKCEPFCGCRWLSVAKWFPALSPPWDQGTRRGARQLGHANANQPTKPNQTNAIDPGGVVGKRFPVPKRASSSPTSQSTLQPHCKVYHDTHACPAASAPHRLSYHLRGGGRQLQT